jgi:hypothetical protein
MFAAGLVLAIGMGAAQGAERLRYAVDGTNLDGSSYAGTAEIVLTSDTTCEIFWKTGSSTSSGICMRYGDAFSAGYALGNSIGLVIYKINEDGSLDGIWTVAGANGNGTEKLTPR